MVAMSRSGQKKQPRMHLVGRLPATITSAALIVLVLLGAGCGRAATRTGTSRPHPAATPTSAILPEASLSWTVGKLLPSSPCALGDRLAQNGLGVDPGDGGSIAQQLWYLSATSASARVHQRSGVLDVTVGNCALSGRRWGGESDANLLRSYAGRKPEHTRLRCVIFPLTTSA